MREKRAVLWSRPVRLFRLDEITAYLGARGLSLVNPTTGAATLVSDLGDPVAFQPHDLPARFDRDGLVRFNLWLDGSHNLFTKVSANDDDSICLYFGLDGLDGDHVVRLRTLLLQLLLSWTGGEAIGLVIDSDGCTEGFDWLSWIRSVAGTPPAWPDLLAMRSEAVLERRSIPESYERTSANGFIILRHPTVPPPNLERAQPE